MGEQPTGAQAGPDTASAVPTPPEAPTGSAQPVPPAGIPPSATATPAASWWPPSEDEWRAVVEEVGCDRSPTTTAGEIEEALRRAHHTATTDGLIRVVVSGLALMAQAPAVAIAVQHHPLGTSTISNALVVTGVGCLLVLVSIVVGLLASAGARRLLGVNSAVLAIDAAWCCVKYLADIDDAEARRHLRNGYSVLEARLVSHRSSRQTFGAREYYQARYLAAATAVSEMEVELDTWDQPRSGHDEQRENPRHDLLVLMVRLLFDMWPSRLGATESQMSRLATSARLRPKTTWLLGALGFVTTLAAVVKAVTDSVQWLQQR